VWREYKVRKCLYVVKAVEMNNYVTVRLQSGRTKILLVVIAWKFAILHAESSCVVSLTPQQSI
jgi:hypothetical protein